MADWRMAEWQTGWDHSPGESAGTGRGGGIWDPFEPDDRAVPDVVAGGQDGRAGQPGGQWSAQGTL